MVEAQGSTSVDLRYQIGALATWLIPFQFWLLIVWLWVATLRLGSWLVAWPQFFAVFRTSLVISLLQFILIIDRHLGVCVRKNVYSDVVCLLRALVLRVRSHVFHAFVGTFTVYQFMELMSIEVVTKKIRGSFSLTQVLCVGGLCGFLYSFLFYFCGRNEILFPSLQQRGSSRMRRTLGPILYRGFLCAVAITCVMRGVVGRESHVIYARVLLLSWLVFTSFDISAELYTVFMTSSKRIGDCTKFAVSEQEEVELLAKTLDSCEIGSFQEALLSFPFFAVVSPQQFDAYRKTRTDCTCSKLMEYAKAHEIRTLEAQKLNISDQRGFAYERIKIQARDSLHAWWVQTCESIVTNSITTSSWEQVVELRQRRFNAVVQAVYTADANQPGYAFSYCRERMGASKELIRARSFLDLAILSEFSPGRRRDLYIDRAAWFRVFEDCTSEIDALSITLMVATKYSALSPTVPVSGKGGSLLDVFVLGPSPDDENWMDTKQEKRRLAWKAEMAARKLRRQPWVSPAWWKSVFVSEFLEYDPLGTQFLLEQEEEKVKSSRKKQNTNVVPDDPVSVGNLRHRRKPNDTADVCGEDSRRFAWEQQWERQQNAKSNRLVRFVKSFLFRTPNQRTSALLSDSQTIMWSITALGNLVFKSFREDPSGNVAPTVPASLICLLECLVAIDAYVGSPAFWGSVDPPPELEGNQLCRMEVMSIQFVLERAVFSIAETFHERLSSMVLPARLTAKLESLVRV